MYERFRQIDPDYAEMVERIGVKYRRVMPDQDDCRLSIGRSWRSTFQTESKEEAEQRMREVGMTWTWLPDGSLDINRTAQGDPHR